MGKQDRWTLQASYYQSRVCMSKRRIKTKVHCLHSPTFREARSCFSGSSVRAAHRKVQRRAQVQARSIPFELPHFVVDRQVLRRNAHAASTLCMLAWTLGAYPCLPCASHESHTEHAPLASKAKGIKRMLKLAFQSTQVQIENLYPAYLHAMEEWAVLCVRVEGMCLSSDSRLLGAHLVSRHTKEMRNEELLRFSKLTQASDQ